MSRRKYRPKIGVCHSRRLWRKIGYSLPAFGTR